MKIKNQERLRALLQIGGFLVSYGIFLSQTYNPSMSIYENAVKMNSNAISKLSLFPYTVDVLLSGYTTRKTDEYVYLKHKYDEVLNNTKNLMEQLGVSEDPIKVFIVFNFLYRAGFCSYNHDFIYDSHMIDLPNLNGLDVVNGTGVCRSIAAFLRDLYKVMGYESRMLNVNATSKSLGVIKENNKCSVKLQASDKGMKFAKIVGRITDVIRIGNHAITYVESKDRKGYILDPTNDGVLVSTKSELTFKPLNKNDAKINERMLNHKLEEYLLSIMGMFGSIGDIKTIIKRMKCNDLTEEEYDEIYSEVQMLIDNNTDLINKYYDENEELYFNVNDVMKNQKGLIQRMFVPWLPNKKERK